jgi:hypothetical protein
MLWGDIGRAIPVHSCRDAPVVEYLTMSIFSLFGLLLVECDRAAGGPGAQLEQPVLPGSQLAAQPGHTSPHHHGQVALALAILDQISELDTAN